MGLLDKWLHKFLDGDASTSGAEPADAPTSEPVAKDTRPLQDVFEQCRRRLTLDAAGARFAESDDFQRRLQALDGAGRRKASELLLSDALLVTKNLELRRMLAERLVTRGDRAGASDLLDALKEHPAHREFAWTTLGEIAETDGDHDAALTAYQHVLATNIGAEKPLARARRLLAKRTVDKPTSDQRSTIHRSLGARAAGSRYSVEYEHGRGGAATVFRAKDRSTGRDVALKIYHAKGDPAQRRKRLLQEAKVAGAFDHPHIVPILDVDPDRDMLAMMFCDGGSLRDRLTKGRLSRRAAMDLGAILLRTLSDVHSRDCLHLDIKPSNVLFHKDRPLICDFGSAGLHKLGRAAGTRAYMAPEQSRGGLVSPAADIYACGLLIFEAIAGRLPDTLEDAPVIELTELDASPQRRGLEHILSRLCAADPLLRPSNGALAAQELLVYGSLPETEADGSGLLAHMDALTERKTPEARKLWQVHPLRAVLSDARTKSP